MKRSYLNKSLLLLSALALSGCSDSDCMDGMCDADVAEDFAIHRAPLKAQCSIHVQGFGEVAMESDYVPGVTACENGNSGTEGLKAQAVSARTFAYYKLSINAGTASNPIKNSQGDQVYSCSHAKTQDKHRAAANATSGTVLTYSGQPICAFYVSGSKPEYLNSECKFTGNSSSTGWVSQQGYVTYNYGKTGNDITQSKIGWVSTTNIYNRGCMSQNGATCLANAGKDWKYIAKFFYGSDIGFTQAEGSCVSAPAVKCETVIGKSGGTIEETDHCFSQSSSSAWYELSTGSGGHLYYTYVWEKAAEVIGKWELNLEAAGKYKVEAYIQSGVTPLSEKAPYVVRANGSEKQVAVNLSGKSGWVTIGTYDFAKGGDQWVKLSDASGEPYTDSNGKRIVFDAIRLSVAESCTNACTDGAKECSGNGVRTCSKGTNGCTSWSAVKACATGQVCESGVCKQPAATCTDACTDGAKECSGNGVRTCSKGTNGCTAWSAVTACGADQTCSAGACKANCQNECTKGEKMCDNTGVKSCETVNGCMKWKNTACGSDEVCVSGACVSNTSTCQDECKEGEVRCQNTGVSKCEKNALGCMAWGSSKSCGDGKICSNGSCVSNTGGSMDYEPWTGGVAVMPEACDTVIDGRPSVIIDELNKCFVRANSIRWSELFSYGMDDHLYYAYITDGMPSAVGTWHLNVTKAGSYAIYVYVDNNIGAVSTLAPYTVRYGGKNHSYGLDLSGKSGWYKIDDIQLSEGKDQYVQLMDATGEDLKDNSGKRVVFDAIQVVPSGTVVEGVVDPNAKDDDEPTKPEIPGQGNDNDDPSDPSVVIGGHSASADDCSSTPLSVPNQLPLGLLVASGLLGLSIRRRRDNV